jgi:hypothetical protein
LVVGDNRFSGCYPCSGQDQISFEFQISLIKSLPPSKMREQWRRKSAGLKITRTSQLD